MERLWNSNYIKVMTTNFLLYFAFYLLVPLLPLYLSDAFHASKGMTGIVLFGYTVAAIVFRPFSGYVVDGFDRKKVLMICLFSFFIFFFGYLAAGSLLMFAIIRTLHGAPFGAVTVANTTAAIDVLPASRRNEGLGYYGLSNNLSMAAAPAIAIYIYHYTRNFELLFWFALIIALLALVVDAFVKLPKRTIVKDKTAMSLDRFFLTRAWLLAVNIMFFGFCFGTVATYIAIYGATELKYEHVQTGMFFLLLSLGLIISRLTGAKSLRVGKLTENAIEGTIIAALGYILFVAFDSAYAYYGSAFLIGLGQGHLYPAFMNMFIDVAHHNERGTANSSILMAWDTGYGFGVLVAGIVAQFFGYRAAFVVVAAVGVLGMLLFLFKGKNFFLQKKLYKVE